MWFARVLMLCAMSSGFLLISPETAFATSLSSDFPAWLSISSGDSLQAARISLALRKDQELANLAIRPEVRGNHVVLHGTAATSEQIKRATQIARMASGLSRIDSRIVLIREQQIVPFGPVAPSSSRHRYHLVQNGQSLHNIASEHGLTVAELKHLNNLRSNQVRTGQRLLIEPSQPQSSSFGQIQNTDASNAAGHEVATPTLQIVHTPLADKNLDPATTIPEKEPLATNQSDITSEHKADDLTTRNAPARSRATSKSLISHTSPNSLHTLPLHKPKVPPTRRKPAPEKRPTPKPERTTPPVTENTAYRPEVPERPVIVLSAHDGALFHHVQPRETLWQIAQAYGISTTHLMRINDLETDYIQIGQRLRITPDDETAKAPAELFHRVQRGETLWQIASRYNTTPTQIKRINGLRSHKIRIGQRLRIDNEPNALPAAKYYTIRRGDTLWKLSKQFETTPEDLMQLNAGLSAKNFRAGRRIRVTSAD